ncbi:hypothetical protein BVRB_4g081240 [Beta vulgaris subsp. vulgaris]|nr:hypothetical protein BVRB_4g081240 [Beta vulgaris subsp. vulgaris]
MRIARAWEVHCYICATDSLACGCYSIFPKPISFLIWIHELDS